MADPAYSAFLQVIFQTVLNFITKELELEHDLRKEIQDLKKNVAIISATLNEADKSDPSQPLKLWLNELRDVSYNAVDLLDEHYYELLRRKSLHFPQVRNKLSIINPKRISRRHGMSHEIKKVSDDMNRVFQRRINFGLNINHNQSSSATPRDRLEITASLPPTHIVGREDEKNHILKMLMLPSDDADVQVREPKLKILAIHGMGRIGKTTLAQLIYNDQRISKHFDVMRLWVHVSCEFDLEKVTRSILDSMGEVSCHGINLDTLQRRIQKKLEGKRYLLVLDDFSNEKPHEWEKLIRPLHKGAPGSVIIVTTRTRLVAEVVSTFPSYHLKELSDHGCYALVSQYASRDDRGGACASATLDALKSEIIKTCRGVPEEAINLGYQLRREEDREKWNEIIVKWAKGPAFPEERNNVFINSMRLSYSRLPSSLKPCLAYCSIIPKGSHFEKEWIVQLWMAQSFIITQGEQSVEDIGNTYFDWLVERSFFQRTMNDDLHKDQCEYIIPDLVNEIARHTSAQECCIFELGKPHNLTSTTRHMSIVFNREQLSCTQDTFTEIYNHCKGLYTLLIIGGSFINQPLRLRFPDDSLGRLRTLDLSYCNHVSLPTNIGDLKHLRYLQLRNSNIQELPESVCNLYNLQTLGLRNCFLLRKLPKETKRLHKLRHLDLHLDYLLPNVNQSTPSHEVLESMPPGIGLLTNLQVLSRFVVSTTRHCGIDELRNLNGLRGELSISNLDLVRDPDDASKANLHEKRCIKRFNFLWRGLHERSEERKRTVLVLENLKPSSVIKELNIVGYPGETFPSWLGSAAYFIKLHTIFLSDCPNCIVLPPLGNLPMLQDLHITGMNSLNYIDCTLCGSNPVCSPSLKKLVFENMANVKRWHGDENCIVLSHLNELVLKNCSKLERLTHNFPSLTKLTIENLPSFIGLRRYPSLKYLKVIADHWIWDSWPCLSSLFSLTLSQLSSKTLPANLPKILNSLRSLEISHCNDLTMMPDDWIPSGVTSLCIRQCPMLRQLPKGLETLKTLEDLEIQDCKGLELLPELKNLKSLTRLEISGCHSFVFLPREGLPHALHFLSISDCPLFSKQLEDFQSPDRIKIQHVSSAWIDQKHFTSTPSPGFEPKLDGSRSRADLSCQKWACALLINLSEIGFVPISLSEAHITKVVQILGCQQLDLPTTYLVLPLTRKKTRKTPFLPPVAY